MERIPTQRSFATSIVDLGVWMGQGRRPLYLCNTQRGAILQYSTDTRFVPFSSPSQDRVSVLCESLNLVRVRSVALISCVQEAIFCNFGLGAELCRRLAAMSVI